MKSQGKRDDPESDRRQPAAPDVAHDHSLARDAVHFAQQVQRIESGEVMQHLRAHDDVDTIVREGQTSCVGMNRKSHRGTAGYRQAPCGIEADGRQLDALFPGDRSGAAGNVAQPSTDIEQRRFRRQFPECFFDLGDGRADSAE